MNQPSFRDVEMLSAYLDGELAQVDSARLETRIKADPRLRSIYDDLRQSRSLMRKLPARRAPRNFTLTPKMAGIKPPLPRAFPVFRLASALAAVLLLFSYAINLSVPAVATLRAAAPAPAFGMGGGGAPGEQPAAAMAPAGTEIPAPAEMATEAPLPTQAPFAAQDNTVLPTATAEMAPTELAVQQDTLQKRSPDIQTGSQPQSVPVTLPVPPVWLFGLLALTVISGGTALFVRTKMEQDWRKANAVKPRKMTTRDIVVAGLVLLAILLLGAGIYWMSTTTFYAPVAQTISYPSGPAGGDKGGGVLTDAQLIHIDPGLGYNFSAADNAGLVTAIDFPAGAVQAETDLRYIPGLETTAPDSITYFADRAFTLIPLSKFTVLQAPISITIDYDNNISAAANGKPLSIYWWSGSMWLDAATTCSPASVYSFPAGSDRISVAACQFGTYLLVAP